MRCPAKACNRGVFITAVCHGWMVLVIALLPAAIARAQEAPAAAVAAVDPAPDVEPQLRALALQLDDKDAGEAAVAKLVELGDVRVKLILDRLMARTLYVWGGAVVHSLAPVKEPGGAVVPLIDLLSDEPLKDAAGQPLRVPEAQIKAAKLQGTRQARKAAQNALLVVDLTLDDESIRLGAAKRVGDSREAAALPKLLELAQSDESPAVRAMAAESALLIKAGGAAPEITVEQRVEAIRELGSTHSLRGAPFLEGLLKDPQHGGLDEAVVVPVARQALKQIDRYKSLIDWLGYTFQGLSAGSILVLLALGLAITFGVMGVINMAHGEMLMIGAVTTWASYEFIGPLLPAGWINWYYVIALPLSFLTAASVGLLIELLIVRFLYKRPLDSLLATIGVSFILIQAVRLWKGDNLGMSAPTWFTGGVEVMNGLIFPYNRLFIMALAACCVIVTALMFRFTKLGLMIRATVQNREMAQSLGVNTRLVDALTFAYGAGIAGIAGYAIVLLSNPTPEMGQGYIIKSFLVVVVGGVGKLLGVIVSGLSLGFLEKFIEPMTILEQPIRIFDATWAQVLVLLLVVGFIQRKPSGLFPDKGRLADRADTTAWVTSRRSDPRRDVILGFSLAVIGLLIVPLLYVSGLLSIQTVNKLGYFTAFAIVAVGLDLVWGYTGVLSLCQFVFFAIGGYCMGLYLINYGPMDGAHGDIPRALYVVMSDVSGARAPWFLGLFKHFPVAVFLGLLLPGVLALLIGATTFRSRVRGVYFAILTQAIAVAFWLVFQKNDMKLGGTNGLTNFVEILGFTIAGDPSAPALSQTRFWLYIASVVCLLVVLVIGRFVVASGFGRVLTAIRDDETRLLFRGYQAWVYKTAAFTLAAICAGLGGMLYVPQMGIITPRDLAASMSIMVVVWVALGGRGTLWGAAIGALAVSLLYDRMTSLAPRYWLFVLGTLFIVVPLYLPGGLMSLPSIIATKFGRLQTSPAGRSAVAASPAASPEASA